MVVHWWHRREDAHWRESSSTPPAASFSAIVFIAAGITKFTAGAWVAVLTIGLLVAMIALRIRHHYDLVGKAR